MLRRIRLAGVSRHCIAVLVSVVCFGTPPAAAENFEWDTPTSGSFISAANWTQPFGPPTATDNALFNKPGSYTVSFPIGPAASSDLRVNDGNVTF